MKNRFLTTVLTAFMLVAAPAGGYAQANRTHVLSSDKSSLVVTTNDGGTAYYQYFGPRISSDDISGLFGVNANFTGNTLPTFGPDPNGEKALSVEMPDGNMSLDLKMDSLRRTTDGKGELLILTFTDRVYPLTVRQYFRHYAGTEVFSTWYDITNNAKKGAVKLITFASASVPFTRSNNYLTQFHGGWGSESYMTEEKLPDGQTVIADKAGLRNAFGSNPGFMISIDGKPAENAGEVFGCNLLWSGNYKTRIEASANRLNVISGINDDTSLYSLVPGETFSTPEFVMTFSKEGKGGVSRAFHKWARLYAIANGDKLRDVLLNSWEGVYFNVNQETMDQMMGDIASLGGELFVMDDGWFGDKYRRDNESVALGDWVADRVKLPGGIKALTDSARKAGVGFGLWLEPEMADISSEIYEKHPDWIVKAAGREPVTGRGGAQVVLDFSNPRVRDHVVATVDRILKENPLIEYVKWDCNSGIYQHGSQYLPKDRQSHLNIAWHRGLEEVLSRIREKYPDLNVQACAGGGGRVNWGVLKYFDEFWTSDNMDALERIFIQWGTSHFYPAMAMASHISASPNHQTLRSMPIKYRADVAMSGRLGVELQPKDMTEEEYEVCRNAISDYKRIRDIVQLGDLYRLRSPYDEGGVASLMYVSENKDRAVAFWYRTDVYVMQILPVVKMDGLDTNAVYRITELNRIDDSPLPFEGKCFSGSFLMNHGLDIPYRHDVAKERKNEFSSRVLLIEKI